MNKNALTLTVVANMTSNYSEGLGNIASVQKVFKNRKIYSMRSRESLKNAIMVQSGWYDDLQTEVDGATQKKVNEDLNAINCRALEGGYMNTKATTYVRRSSFYLTDAISTEHFISEPRFHNNLYMATNYAKNKGLSVQEPGKNNIGLMPYQYEYDKSLKIYTYSKKNISLDSFLNNIDFHIDNYKSSCNFILKDEFYLLIETLDNNKTVSYKIPLKLKNNCKQ